MKQKHNLKFYLWLAWTNFYIGAFTFGGGYVVISMIEKSFIEQKHLFSNDELFEMAAIAQSSPGAIAMNLAVLVGNKVAELLGVLISSIFSLLPSIMIISIVASGFDTLLSNGIVVKMLHGMEAGVIVVMLDLIIKMYATVSKESSKTKILLIPLVFVATFVFNLNVGLVILVSLLILILEVVFTRKQVQVNA